VPELASYSVSLALALYSRTEAVGTMGLFDGFTGSNVSLNPKMALAAGMIYITAADGHLDPNERGDVFKVVPDDAILDAALQFVRRTQFPQFLEQASRMLSPAQKLCLMLNMIDTAMGDGYLAPEEQTMLMQVAQAFQIPDTHLHPYVQTLMVKNNLTVFG
jgi:uncharacterized tellurite resistance protein B-like protein